jgi:hypothetical protein
MSNYIQNQNVPGVVRGNPLQGLCEKVSINVDKVFSSCLCRETKTGYDVEMITPMPQGMHPPYKFLTGSGTVTSIENLIVTDLADEKCLSRVQCDVVITVDVTYVDSMGKKGVGTVKVVVPKDVIMKVPQPSLLPYEIKAKATCTFTDADFVSQKDLKVTACITIILEVVINVQLLVPSYGYTHIPPCQKYTEEVCVGVYELPIYPEDCR